MTVAPDIFRLLLQLAAAGIGLIIFFALFRKFSSAAFLPDFLQSFFNRYLLFAEFIIYSIFILYAVYLIFPAQPLMVVAAALVIVVIAAASGRKSLSDYFEGISLRSETELRKGEWISAGDVEGVIRERGRRALMIECEDGRKVRLSYSLLTRNSFSVKDRGDKTLSRSFTLTVDDKTPAGDLIHNLKVFILNSPWSSVRQPPEISYTGNDENENIFEVTIFTTDESFFPLLETSIKKAFK